MARKSRGRNPKDPVAKDFTRAVLLDSIWLKEGKKVKEILPLGDPLSNHRSVASALQLKVLLMLINFSDATQITQSLSA